MEYCIPASGGNSSGGDGGGRWGGVRTGYWKKRHLHRLLTRADLLKWKPYGRSGRLCCRRRRRLASKIDPKHFITVSLPHRSPHCELNSPFSVFSCRHPPSLPPPRRTISITPSRWVGPAGWARSAAATLPEPQVHRPPR